MRDHAFCRTLQFRLHLRYALKGCPHGRFLSLLDSTQHQRLQLLHPLLHLVKHLIHRRRDRVLEVHGSICDGCVNGGGHVTCSRVHGCLEVFGQHLHLSHQHFASVASSLVQVDVHGLLEVVHGRVELVLASVALAQNNEHNALNNGKPAKHAADQRVQLLVIVLG